MEIVILFERISKRELHDKDREFSKAVSCAAVNCFGGRGEGKDPVAVALSEQVLEHAPEAEKVAVIIRSAQGATNMGKAIVDFKNETLKIFNAYGIVLEPRELSVKVNPAAVAFSDGLAKQTAREKKADEFDYQEKSKQYVPVEPSYSFERVILADDVVEKIQEAVAILQCENKVFREWGLYEIQPHPSTSLSFYGPPGTGKTMAAEAIAKKLGKKILKVSYADVESKYHGEGPKMVKAIFLAASNTDAVLFFDEADSLLSKRLTNVSQGSEQAINSMRSQLLICLEEFRGIVIFATNLVVNYDQAFLTRLISVEFKLPDSGTRKKIWDMHIKAPDDGGEHQLNIPLAEDVDTAALAKTYEFVGREIRNAVVSACVSVAMDGREIVSQADLTKACDRILEEKEALARAKDHTVGASKTSDMLKEAIKNKLKQTEGGETSVPEHAE